MKQQQNPDQKNNLNEPTRPASEKNEKLSTNNPPADKKSSETNDDYKRAGVHLGASASGNPDTTETGGSTQKGGGGSGYDVSREQHEVNREQEIMHTERDEDKLHPERTQNPQPAPTPERQNPQPTKPEEPKTQPGTSTQNAANRNIDGAWSHSSRDSRSSH